MLTRRKIPMLIYEIRKDDILVVEVPNIHKNRSIGKTGFRMSLTNRSTGQSFPALRFRKPCRLSQSLFGADQDNSLCLSFDTHSWKPSRKEAENVNSTNVLLQMTVGTHFAYTQEERGYFLREI